MTSTIIIALCVLLLLAYLFDLTASKTKIPSVILLLLLGWLLHRLTDFLKIQLPDFSPVLPVLGTIGLILIVLEGSLELELDSSKVRFIGKTFLGALIPILALSFLLAFLFSVVVGYNFKDCLSNAIPFSIISSAIAIPSVRHLRKSDHEFIVYESSLSDILGVVFFNFVTLHKTFGIGTFANFGLNLFITMLVSFIASLGLTILLRKIEHHIKFMPIIFLVILIYIVSKIYHLPSLVFIMFFGIFLGNLHKFGKFKWIEKLRPEELKIESKKFKDLTIEGAFLIRALFFLLFGYLLKTSEILNTSTIFWAAGIVAAIFAIRAIQLWLSRLPLNPLLYVAPRGLITILLYLSLEPGEIIPLVNNSLIIQVILLSSFIMMFGLMAQPKQPKTDIKIPESAGQLSDAEDQEEEDTEPTA